MRIIGGQFKGRRLNPPAKNWPTRPTTDFSRESLYNILTNRVDFEDMVMLDLFAGTGAHCFECISRGCEDVTYVDQFAPAATYAKEIAKSLDVTDFIKVFKTDALTFIKNNDRQYSFIFADPPYEWPKVASFPDVVMASNMLADEGVFVFEHQKKHDFSGHADFVEARFYGATVFSFFEKK